MVRKYPVTDKTEDRAISMENNPSSGASKVTDSERTQARLIGPRDVTDKIADVLVNYGFTCSGVEPERGYAEGTRYRCYLVAPTTTVRLKSGLPKRRIGNR